MRRFPVFISALIAAAAAILVSLVGCQGSASDDARFVVADLFATQGKALATAALSPTPPATATIENQAEILARTATLALPTQPALLQPTNPVGIAPTPTRSAEPTSALPAANPPACPPPEEPFGTIWAANVQAQTLLGCPVGSAYDVPGAIQYFEKGTMFWRQSDRSVFVLSESAIRQGQTADLWWRFDDTYQEGEPESDPNLAPPAGLLQPVRGFGKIWRNNAFIREAVGWAAGNEFGMVSRWQDFERGWMMTGPDGRPVFALAPDSPAPYNSGSHLGSLR